MEGRGGESKPTYPPAEWARGMDAVASLNVGLFGTGPDFLRLLGHGPVSG